MLIVVLKLADVPVVFHNRGKIRGSWIEMPENWEGVMPSPPAHEWPAWAKTLDMAKIAGETGVGDTAERIFGRIGGNQFKAATKLLGIKCGCGARKEDWNRRFRYDTG
jgi:hypothetical protein